MKKFITYLLLVIVVILLVYWCIPKSCEPSGKYEQLQRNSDRSLIIDSIQKLLTEKVNKKSDSLINIYKDSLAVIKFSKEKIEYNYYALRSIVKKLQSVKVDSFNQVVKVPVIEYNASINSGTMCDSLLMYQDAELNLKDSIISVREIQLIACRKENDTKEQALQDLIALNNEEKKQKERAKVLNKKIPLIAGICAIGGFILATFALK